MSIPRHIAIIMDGNRRWAKNRNLDTKVGHREGVEALEKIVKAAIAEGVKYLTVYALSTENLAERQKSELRDLFSLLRSGFIKKLPVLEKEGVNVRFIGNVEKLPLSVRKIIQITANKLKKNSRLYLNIAIGYGSREELVEAIKKVEVKEINQESFSQFLYTKDIPDPDLLIRTGGQIRLSNFLLWQIAYSELYFTDTLWPDFDEKEFRKAVSEFSERKRNFGA